MTEKKLEIRGSCGFSLPLFQDVAAERLYTNKNCPNPSLMLGSSPETVRAVCLNCAEKFQKIGRQDSQAVIVPTAALTPVVEKSASNNDKDKGMHMAIAMEPALPLNIPSPGFSTPVREIHNTEVPGPTVPNETTCSAIKVTPSTALTTHINPPAIEAQQAPQAPQVSQVSQEQQMQLQPQPEPQSPQVTLVNEQQQPAQPPTVQPPPAAPLNLPQSSPLAPVSTSFLPGMNLAGMDDQSAINIDEVLSKVEGLEGGPSSGGFSWHDLMALQQCPRKAYFTHVLGLQKKFKSSALAVGTLVHACFEMHYRTGGQRTFEPCDVVAAAGAVDIAAEARRLVYAQLQKFGGDEAATWDVRGIENQGTWFMPPAKIGGRTVHIPLTCRHDLIVGLRKPGAPCTPPGQPVPGGCFVVDWKTCRAITYDLSKGYGRDGQFLMNALIYTYAEAAEFGELAGVIVSLIAKPKRIDPDKHLQRIHTSCDFRSVEEFYQDEVRPLAIDFYTRLKNDADDMKKWPKCTSSCVGQYGPCFYFDICDCPPGGEEAIMNDMYTVDADRIKNLDNLRQPTNEYKQKAGKTEAEITNAANKRAAAKVMRDRAKQLVASALFHYFERYDGFKMSEVLGHGWSAKEVKFAYNEKIQHAWEVGTEFDIPLTAEGAAHLGAKNATAHIRITEKGLIWNLDGVRSSWTWGSLTTLITKEWWNPTTQNVAAADSETAAYPS